jgi:hypothetical protein
MSSFKFLLATIVCLSLDAEGSLCDNGSDLKENSGFRSCVRRSELTSIEYNQKRWLKMTLNPPHQTSGVPYSVCNSRGHYHVAFGGVLDGLDDP